MSGQDKPKDEKYEGASNSTIALGQASMFGWAGKISGFFIGAAASLFSTSEGGKYTAEAAELIQKIRPNSKVSPRFALAAGWAFAGQWIGHYVGLAVGINHATHGIGKGRAQFERIKAERNQAQHELAGLKNTLNALSKEAPALEVAAVSDSIKEPPAATEPHAGHVAAYQAGQATDQAKELVR